jgi:hypothetical protein
MYKNFSQDFWLVGLAKHTRAQGVSDFGFVFVHFSILQVFPKILRSSRRLVGLRIAENPNVRDLVIIGLRLGLIASSLKGRRIECWVCGSRFFWGFRFCRFFYTFFRGFCYFRFLCKAESFYSKARDWFASSSGRVAIRIVGLIFYFFFVFFF